ncbi:MAG: CehA/McbA family metallohydrolase [Myxococcota bacterium]
MRVLAFSVLLVACDGSLFTSDGGLDGGGEDATDAAVEVCEGVAPFEVGDAMGHEEPLGSSSTEARAGRVTEDDLPPDPTRLLTWAAGDYVLANDRVAMVIEAAGPSDGYDPWGGKPVGLAQVEEGRLVRPADYNEVIIGVGRHTFEASSVAVLNAGGEEGATVRAIGTLRPIPFIDDIASGLAPGDFSDLQVAVDYTLAPGAEQVDITLRIANTRAGGVRSQKLYLIFQSRRMPIFGPDTGFRVREGDATDWLGFADDDATSYALDFVDDEPTFTLEISGAILLQGERLILSPCQVADVPYVTIPMGQTMDGVRSAIWRARDEATRTVEGTVLEADGSPAVGVRVHAESDDGALYYSRALTGDDGTYRLTVPDGAALRFRAFRPGDGVLGPFNAPDFEIPGFGTLAVRATDGAGTPLPVRVQTRPVGDGEPAAPERFGEAPQPSRRTHVEMAAEGTADLRVRPGEHRVIVSHGYEFTMFDSDVEVASGERLEIPVVLDRVVDTTDVMCADYHIHTNRSPDSEDSPIFKLRSAAADGLEIPCRSDHEWVREWESVIANEGLASWLYGVTSLELTTFAWGHFGVVPMEERPTLPNFGSIDWIDRLPPDVFATVRALEQEPVLIINHPRGANFGGYFSAAGYDPVTGEVSNPELWDELFTAVEVFNDDSFDEASMEVADWFSFLNQGRKVWGVGSSDTHNLRGGSPVGYPRTCLRLGVDDPEALRAGGGEMAVRDATRDGRFVVSGGVYLEATARGEVRPGGTVTGAAARETVRVRVQAAPWIDVDTLEVWADGNLVESVSIPETTDVVRFDGDLEVEGNWVVFHAKGDDSLDPVHPDRMPFGVTMPIFFER